MLNVEPTTCATTMRIQHLVFGLAILSLVPPSVTADYYTLGALSAQASGGAPDDANDGYTMQLVKTDDVVAAGPAGNGAELHSIANLLTGKLAIWGGSNNALGTSGFYDGADATGKVEFRDTLTVSVPAGFYAAQELVTVDTLVSGAIQTSSPLAIDSFVNGLVRWDMVFWNKAGGPNTVYTGTLGFVSHGDSAVAFDPVTLSTELFPAGTTLTAPTTYELELTASLWVIRNESFNPTAPNATTVDFGNSLSVLSVNTPLGLDFGSESGVFLSAVPLPATALLLLAPLALVKTRRLAWTAKWGHS